MLPARPDLPPARPDVIHPPLIPDVYPPPHPEIIYPSRVPPPHRKRERNNLSLHRVHLASLETCISREQCAPFRALGTFYLLYVDTESLDILLIRACSPCTYGKIPVSLAVFSLLR